MNRTILKAAGALSLALLALTATAGAQRRPAACPPGPHGTPPNCVQARAHPATKVEPKASPSAPSIKRYDPKIWKALCRPAIPRNPKFAYMMKPSDLCLNGKMYTFAGNTICYYCRQGEVMAGSSPYWKCMYCQPGYSWNGSFCCSSPPQCPPGSYGTPPNCQYIR